jgi:hypothetical protein
MKSTMKSRRAAIAYSALALAVVVGGPCAADEERIGRTVPSVRMPAQAASATSPGEQQCVGQPLLVGPDGHKFPLAYVAGYGCRYVVDEDSAVLAVGPNGYAFEWTRVNGWKLIKAAD